MKQRLVAMLSYLILPVFVYWVPELYRLLAFFGFLSDDTMTYKGLMVTTLLVWTPLIVGLVSVVHGLHRGFTVWLPIAVMALFVPTILYTYLVNHAHGIEVYTWYYGLVSLLGLLLGVGMREICEKIKQTP